MMINFRDIGDSQGELDAYDSLSIEYFYLGEIKKAKYY